MEKYKFNKYGNGIEFTVGQKVECSYYHEYDSERDGYERTLLEKLIDKPFKPVKHGIIVGDAGIHPYWLAGADRKEQYLLVKFKEYRLAKPIPISCIKDAHQSYLDTMAFLERDKDKIGQKGYSQEAFDSLYSKALQAKEFTSLP